MLRVRGDVMTDEQRNVLEIVGRTASGLSALGVLTIITVFCLAPHFRNPMHRLIFINAFYNAFDVVCTMISIGGPAAGNSSALCQFQAFLNQMFPLADVLWTLAMAINVFLIVFRRYDSESLKRLEWKYTVAITTITFIPAFAFLFVRTEEKGPLYGSVTLWCSISPKWVLFRIIFYYIPIWSMILLAMAIYVLVGIEIARRRGAFQSINSDTVMSNCGIVFPTDAAYNNLDNEVAMDAVDVHSQRGEASTSHSRAESLHTASKRSIVASSYTTTTQHVSTTHQSSASFRQYILMPLFFFVALLSVWVAPSTNRVMAFINPEISSYPLLLAVSATGGLRGFWNGVIFITIGMKSRRR